MLVRKFTWYRRRLRAMTASELGRRIMDVPRSQFERWRHAGRRSPTELALARGVDVGTVGTLTFDAALLDAVPAHIRAEVGSRAGPLRSGAYSMLGVDWTADIPCWHFDPWSRTTAPAKFAKDISYRFGERFSAKHIWELNRHQHWIPLALDGRLNGNADSVARLLIEWSTWLDQNPVLIGVNWASPMEIGLRLISWAFASHVLRPQDLDPDLWHAILSSVDAQGTHLARNISSHSSANNHVVGEAAGLFVAGHFFRSLESSARWRDLGRRLILEAFRTQVHDDGSHVELSTGYQFFVWELGLLCALVGRRSGDDLGDAYWATLKRMAQFQAHLVTADGQLPPLGDSDDGIAVGLSPPPGPARSLQLVDCAARLFGEPSRTTVKSKTVSAYAYFMLNGPAPWPDGPTTDLDGSTVFPNAGLIVSRGTIGQRRVHITFDAGPLGLEPLFAHGHADALSFTLFLDDVPLVVDPGTYTYHVDQALRSYFKGTAAHNTVRLDQQDQSIDGGATMWLQSVPSRLTDYSATTDGFTATAEHSGYRRRGAMHRRRFDCNYRSGTISVSDAVEGQGHHVIERFLHLGGRVEISRDAHRIIAHLDGGSRLIVTFDPSETVDFLIGTPAGPGLASPGFHRLETITTLRARTERRLPASLQMEIYIQP